MGEDLRSPLERYETRDVMDLIREYPLAWIVPGTGSAMSATLLPLLVECNEKGNIATLVGHMARRNPLFKALTSDPSATVLFTGPEAYVSPALVSDATWAPSWNYAQVRMEVRVRFDLSGGDEALGLLVAAMERDFPSGWRPEMMGSRYRPMEQAIVAFRADIRTLQARFKLGQDEKPERLREILDRHPDGALVRWMRRFNTARL